MQDGIPDRLARLPELACNLYWSWSPEAQALFERLDPVLWEKYEHNPVRLLQETENLKSAAGDAGFIDSYHRIMAGFDAYMGRRCVWMDHAYPKMREPVAYFSAEFGLHESLPIYSGGLGVLAGDHVKSASDLGVPLVGMGLLYAQGFFRQRIDADGRQQEVYEPFEPEKRPVVPARGPDGSELFVSVELPGRALRLKVWEVTAGRSKVYLLDADISGNSDGDRSLTARLYGGDKSMRLSQELILGIGGVRALRALGLRPAVFHMNEGHAAFLGLERIREYVAAGTSFEAARERAAESAVFTTHTPVPAGHDAFTPDLFWEFMSGWPKLLGTDEEELWRLGSKNEEWGPSFNMTVLALGLSRGHNAVSRLHQAVSLKIWRHFFSEAVGREQGLEEPIVHVTNGIHTASWLSPEMAELFGRHAGGRSYTATPEDEAAWSFVHEIPSAELWENHRSAKKRFIAFANERLARQQAHSGDAYAQPELDPEALTIGFARRFATYKRAALLLHDPERLRRIVTDPARPVQFVFAGKAHPADEPAKEFIRRLYAAAGEEGLAGHIVVLEDYDMNVTRRMVQGSDVWMNNPRRPLEASGTSGQKAALNGAPNFSVLDGWWPEAYNGKNGWIIGEEKEYASEEEQDAADAESLYRTLETEIVPLFYERENGVPRRWTAVMKESITTIAPAFSARRMVRDYVHRLYIPRVYAAVRYVRQR